MKLWAIADLHLRHAANRRALAEVTPRPEDWLILAGDVGSGEADLRYAFELLGERFARLLWVPGNHELWSTDGDALRGEARYRHLVEVCREHGVVTPEDPYPEWPGRLPEGVERCRIAPLFLLYDYSFRPDHVPAGEALAWAAADQVMAADELLLHPDPHPSRAAWCAARCRATETRLAEAARDARLVLVNHWPLRRHHAVLPRVPRFTLWCGTRRSEAWPTRYGALAVVYGHLHIRTTRLEDGVRFEEVSLGYPRHWRSERGVDAYLREILPGPQGPPAGPVRVHL